MTGHASLSVCDEDVSMPAAAIEMDPFICAAGLRGRWVFCCLGLLLAITPPWSLYQGSRDKFKKS
jgi:hypothetical protein